mgnify:CR=1 FL=1
MPGSGVPEDDKTAAKWWKLAAEQGNAPAQFNLGTMYDNGPRYDIERLREALDDVAECRALITRKIQRDGFFRHD